MKKTFGIFAHVDGGKTTFSEQLLYHTGILRSPGRVDTQSALMDSNEIEKARGITIFADQSAFPYGGADYYLVDTPGHVDFAGETERAMSILDYGLVLLNGISGVEAHTHTLFRLLMRYDVPVFFFVNKMDLAGASFEHAMEQLKHKLGVKAVPIDGPDDLTSSNAALVEYLADLDEAFLERYLYGTLDDSVVVNTLKTLISQRKAFVCMQGSALKAQGVALFLEVFHRLTTTSYQADGAFSGLVYKIRHDEKGNRITFFKCLSGSVKVKDELSFPVKRDGATSLEKEKINELRTYSGSRYQTHPQAAAGDLCAVTGPKHTFCGEYLGEGQPSLPYYLLPALQATILLPESASLKTALLQLQQLEEEEPQLTVTYRVETRQICVNIMGIIQLEVLKQLIRNRFGLEVDFAPPEILYKETITAPVTGFGHFEPLRHYAEVNLVIEPGKRGDGITFESRCHVDTLAINYQKLVRSHVFEQIHKGILTGSPLTDVHIALVNGRSHIKHTEGGDFREATCRAIRQGLEKADSLLLEPFYSFEIYVSSEYLGKVLSDLQKRQAQFDPPLQEGEQVAIKGRGPVATLMDYPAQLTAFTRGTGILSLMVSGYDACHNPEEVIAARAYDKGADTAHTSGSVFCSHGTSFVVNWDKAETYMHCLR